MCSEFFKMVSYCTRTSVCVTGNSVWQEVEFDGKSYGKLSLMRSWVLWEVEFFESCGRLSLMRSWVLWEVESYGKLSLMGGWVLWEFKYVGKFFSAKLYKTKSFMLNYGFYGFFLLFFLIFYGVFLLLFLNIIFVFSSPHIFICILDGIYEASAGKKWSRK